MGKIVKLPKNRFTDTLMILSTLNSLIGETLNPRKAKHPLINDHQVTERLMEPNSLSSF